MFKLAIEQTKSGNRIGDIGYAVQNHAESNGYSVVRELVGHGLGRSLHEKPEVPNYGKKGRGHKMKPGLVLAIEPMINLGKRDVKEMPDGWTIVTRDRSLSAQWEHTILVTENGYEVMTISDHSPDKEKNTPKNIFSKLNTSQKRLLGFHLTPPKDEFSRVRRISNTFEKPNKYNLPK